jgi:hypothetical protein
MQIEYLCRCGKLSYSLLEQKRHVKHECHMKHIPLETTGKSFTILEPWVQKEER